MAYLLIYGICNAEILYQDDFSGAAGASTTTVPEMKLILKRRRAKAWHLYFVAGTALLFAVTGLALTFSMVGNPPVVLLEPADNGSTYMIHPHFRWAEDSDADRYEIQIATDSSFATLQQSDSIPVPRYVPLDHLPVNDYWWRVRSRYADGSTSGWSATRKLSVLAGSAYRVYPTNTLSEITSTIAIAAANTPSRLIFSPGDYVFNLESGATLLNLVKVKDFYVYGVSCNITMQNPDSRFALCHTCEDVYMRGFTVEYATNGVPVTHTAGTVVSVDAGTASFVFEPLAGYLPPTDPRIANATQRRWGCLMNTNVPGRLKYNVPDFFDLSDTVADLGNGQYRLYLSAAHAGQITYFDPGDLFVKNAGWLGRQILTSVFSTNITYALITNYGSPGAFFGGNYNDSVHFLGCKSLIKPGRYVSTAADGFIGAGYKTGFWIENCTVEGLLDDCVNASGTHLHIESQVAPNILKLYNASILEVGNHLTLFHPKNGSVEGPYEVRSTVQVAGTNVWTVILDGNVAFVDPGLENGSSQLFIDERAHQTAYIRNSTFRNSRRFGALFRVHDAVIEGNTYVGLGSAAIHAENENNPSFDGGFDNLNVRILNNHMEDCGQTFHFFSQDHGAIEFGISAYGTVCTQTVHQNIEIAGNEIYDWDGKGISVENARDVLIHSNTIANLNATAFQPGGENYGVYLNHTANAMVTGNRLIDERPMDAPIQFENSTNTIVLNNQIP